MHAGDSDTDGGTEVKVEYLSLGLNLVCCLWYVVKWQEPGKILYWLGATILMVGLLKMKG